jgi:hypothetical protein
MSGMICQVDRHQGPLRWSYDPLEYGAARRDRAGPEHCSNAIMSAGASVVIIVQVIDILTAVKAERAAL